MAGGSPRTRDGFGFRGPSAVLLTVLAGALLVPAPPLASVASGRFLRGDANGDSGVSLSDVFAILHHLHLGKPVDCDDAADVDDSGKVELLDALYLVGSLFYRHGPLPEPFHSVGTDPTDDGLGCLRDTPAERVVKAVGAAAGGDPIVLGQEHEGGLVIVDGPCEVDDGGVADLEFIHFRRPAEVLAGQPSARVPVYINTPGGVEGLTLGFRTESSAIHLRSLDIDGTVFERIGLMPAWVHSYDRLVDDGYVALTVAMSLSPPFRTLRALHDQPIAFLEFSVDPAAEVGTVHEIEFGTIPADETSAAIVNELSREGRAQVYSACNLLVHVVSEDELFIRGDANRDWRVDLSDVVTILSRLYRGATLGCDDAADVDDDGKLVITDAVRLATYLFAGGPAPLAPYPEPGRDSLIPDEVSCY